MTFTCPQPRQFLRIAVLSALCGILPLSAVDILGGSPAPSPEPEDTSGADGSALSAAEQAATYRSLFGREEDALRGQQATLEFARRLVASSQEADFAPIAEHMLVRAAELLADLRGAEPLDLRIAIAERQLLDMAHDRTATAALRDLITQRARYARGEEQLALARRMIALHKQDAAAAIAEEQWEQAEADYRAVADLQRRAREREGLLLTQRVLAALDLRRERVEELADLRARATSAPADPDAQRRLVEHLIGDRAWDEALAVLRSANVVGGDDLRIASETAALLAAERRPEPAQAAAAVPALQRLIATTEDPLLRRRFLALGVDLAGLLADGAIASEGTLKLQARLLGDDWQAALGDLGPDPLGDLAELGSSSSLDEARLVAAGWVRLFDHQQPWGVAPEDPRVRVVDGSMHIEPGGELLILRDFDPAAYRAFKIRFRMRDGLTDLGPGINAFAGGAPPEHHYTLHFRHGQAMVHQGGVGSLAQAPVPEGWLDASMRWDGGGWTFRAGDHLEHRVAVPMTPTQVRIWIAPTCGPFEITSILALPR